MYLILDQRWSSCLPLSFTFPVYSLPLLSSIISLYITDFWRVNHEAVVSYFVTSFLQSVLCDACRLWDLTQAHFCTTESVSRHIDGLAQYCNAMFSTYTTASEHGNAINITSPWERNPPVTGGFPHIGSVMQSFDMFVVVSNNLLNKQFKVTWRSCGITVYTTHNTPHDASDTNSPTYTDTY